MKVSATIYYPTQVMAKKKVVIDIPDGDEPVNYIYCNLIDIVMDHIPDLDNAYIAIDAGIAGIEDIEIIP